MFICAISRGDQAVTLYTSTKGNMVSSSYTDQSLLTELVPGQGGSLYFNTYDRSLLFLTLMLANGSSDASAIPGEGQLSQNCVLIYLRYGLFHHFVDALRVLVIRPMDWW